jgi:hypothetical protein
MKTRCLTQYYRIVLIPAFAVLVALSGNNAFADGDVNVQPAQEDSKKSDQNADKDGPVEAKPIAAAQPAPTGEPVYHKASMRLSGSMCYACLKDLQDALLKVTGIEKVRVDKPQVNYFQPASPDVSAWANCVVVYDERLLNLDAVRYAIKTHAYHSYRVTDKPLDHPPTDKDMKP